MDASRAVRTETIKLRGVVKYAEASDAIVHGADHRAVKLTLGLLGKKGSRRQYSTKRIGVGWRPIHNEMYKTRLGSSLSFVGVSDKSLSESAL